MEDLVNLVVPDATVVAASMTAPGVGCARIQGFKSAQTVASALNNFQHPSGVVLRAQLLLASPATLSTQVQSLAISTPPAPVLRHMSEPFVPFVPSQHYFMPQQPYFNYGMMPLAAATATPDFWPPINAGLPPQFYAQPQHPYAAGYPPAQHRHFQKRHSEGGAGTRRQKPPFNAIRLFIGNIPYTTQWQELKDFLRSAGEIYRVEIPLGPDGRVKGYAIATYMSMDVATRAIEQFHGAMFQGRELTVRFDRFNNPSVFAVVDPQV